MAALVRTMSICGGDGDGEGSVNDGMRPGEVASEAPLRADAIVTFIGWAQTPWSHREDCPKQGDRDGPECRLVIDAPWIDALDGIEGFDTVEVLYWLHRARRDLVVQAPRHGDPRGTFALRSPVRPNPIGTALLTLVRREGDTLVVRGLDCLDGTPLIDLKPDRCRHGAPGRP